MTEEIKALREAAEYHSSFAADERDPLSEIHFTLSILARREADRLASELSSGVEGHATWNAAIEAALNAIAEMHTNHLLHGGVMVSAATALDAIRALKKEEQ